jgi:hypothetical protein
VTGAELLAATRRKLLETSAVFWTDAEIYEQISAGVKDLWRAIANQHQDYFWAQDATISFAADATTITAPASCTIVLGLEPADPASYPSMHFFPTRYTDPKMTSARSASASDPGSYGTGYYAITGKGAPGGSGPTIHVAPRVSSAVLLRLIYVPTCVVFSASTASTENPIPGESDQAIVNYAVAYALCKEREDGSPDPGWLALYATEKESILTFTAPRQDDEPDVAEAVFEPYSE